MSESDKMGLFGSKDENNVDKTQENNTSDKPQENSSERFAPYNIDSDSETYDTEALSIMDINDIIGVQADTPEDSTLESEFAALSKFIAESKDEFSPQLQNPVDIKDNKNDSDNQSCSKIIQDATSKEAVITETECPEQSQNPANMPSISKSLQLIGEAYDSEDSEEADSDDGGEKAPKKCSVPSEVPKVSTETTEPLDPGVEVKEAESVDKVPDSEKGEDFMEGTKVAEKTEESDKQQPSLESTDEPSDSSTKKEINKSVDSTDAAVINEPEMKIRDNDAEQMDVDSIVTSDEPKKPTEEIQRATELPNNEDEVKNDLPEKEKLSEVKGAEENADSEEPMEVDEPSEILTTPQTDLVPEKVVEKISEAVDSGEDTKSSIAEEIHDVRSRIVEKLSEDIVDVKFSSSLDTIKEESNAEEEKCSEILENKCEPSQENIEKSEAEQSEKEEEKIVISKESFEDIIQEKTPKDEKSEVVLEKRNTDEGESLESSKKIEEIVAAETGLEGQKEVAEPMEIDDPEPEEIEAPVETISNVEFSEKAEPASEQTIENESSNDDVEKTLETPNKSSEIVEPVEKNEFLENKEEKSLKDSEAIQGTSQSCEKSLEIHDIVAVQPSDNLTQKESFGDEIEDEKMEVDGSLKTTSNKEGLEVPRERDSSENTEKSVVETEMSAETIENKCDIDTVDDAKIASLETEKIIETASKSNICDEKILEIVAGVKPDEPIDEIEENVNTIDKNDENITEVDENKETVNTIDKNEENIPELDENEETVNAIDKNEENISEVDKNEENKNEVEENRENRNQVDKFEENLNQIDKTEKNEIQTEQNEETTNQTEESEETRNEIDKNDQIDELTEEKEILNVTQVPEPLAENSRIEEPEIMDVESTNMLNEDPESAIEKSVTIENKETKEIEAASILVEKIEISNEKTEESEDHVEELENKILDSSENVEDTEQENKEAEEPKSIEESVSNVEEKEELLKTESLIEEEKESLIVPEAIEIDSEKTENTNELEDSISSQKTEDKIHMEISTEKKEESSISCELVEGSSAKIENKDELKDSISSQKPEDIEISPEDEKTNFIVSEKPESPRGSENISSTKDESLDPKEEKISEPSNSEEKEETNVLKTVIAEESENSEKPEGVSDEEAKNVSEISKSEAKEEDSVDSEDVKSPNENESKDLISSTSIESSMEMSKENEVEKSVEKMEEGKPETEKNEESNEIETKSEVLCDEKENESKESSEKEEKEFSRPKLPSEVSSTSENLGDFDMKEDEMEDEMTLSVEDPDMFATGKNLSEDNSRTRESPDRMFVEQEMETEDKTETNLSEDGEEKNEEGNVVQVDNRLEQSEENNEENQEKSLNENLKAILSRSSVSVGQMFNDDEQSQSTQEMMESISETDKGNINKILDEQEASDLETAAMNNDDEQSQSTQEMMDSILETDKENINKILDEQEASDLETASLNNVDKLPEESEDMLSKALADPMGAQNIDSLEGLLDLDLMPENDESNLKSVEPIVDKVMQESCEDIETIGKSVDVGLLMEENDTIENPIQNEDYESTIATKILDNDPQAIASSVERLINKSDIPVNQELPENSDLTDKDLEAFDLASVVTNPLDNVDPSEDTKINLAEDLLREIAVDEERKITLTEKLLLDDDIQEQDLLLSASIETPTKMDMADEVFLPVEAEPDMELAEDISLDIAVRDQVLSDVAAEIESLPATSEISELESAVKFLQESEEQDIESSLVLSPKLVEDVVDEMVENSDVGIFATEADICEDPSELVAELDSIIPDPIAISEAEIINEAAKLEIERKTQMSEKAKLLSPICPKVDEIEEEILLNKIPETPPRIIEEQKIAEVSEELGETERIPEIEKISHEPLKKSAPIPKTSILEERLKIPPKIEIPVGEVTRMCELPTTPKTSLLIQRDARASNLMKQLESPKSVEKGDLKIVDTPRKESEKHDFENVGSPRIILKIAKSAIADCSEPRSPKSPKIRSATNSPNPEDSPGQKLGKIKLKLSKSGHPSIISNDNIEEQCGQWHTEGSSSLSPLGMKIKFSKIPDSPSHQTDRHEADETREQTSKHKFEEAKRTDSPLGMKIKLSKTGDPTIVQQENKESGTKHKDKFDTQQDSPKRTESSIGMKIKLSKSGDASIIQPDKQETMDDHKDGSSRVKDKLEMSQHSERNDTPRRTESPLGMKFKLFKTGDASIVQTDSPEEIQQEIKRTDSPIGKKSKQQKARSTIVSSELNEEMKEKLEIEAPRRTESPLGMKIKLSKRGDASIILSEETREAFKQRPEVVQDAASEGSTTSKTKSGKTSVQTEISAEMESVTETPKRVDPSIGMKIKLSKSGDASIVHTEREENPEEMREKEKCEVHQENTLKIDSSIGMKIKLSKTGEGSIIASGSTKKSEDSIAESENSRIPETLVKTKFGKSSDSVIGEPDKKDKSLRRKETETPLEMKIKLSKTGHPTIVACENYADSAQRGKDINLENQAQVGTSKQSSSTQENSGMKILKSMQAGNLHSSRSELTIEPVQLQARKSEMVDGSVSKRKDITISPVESKKAKLEAKLSHILPEVTIQPIVPREQKQSMMFDSKSGSISRQQMNVISQEISITQVRSTKPMDLTMTDKLKSILTQNAPTPSSDCEIIEHRPELIIVNENSNSSQDVMIIEEVPVIRPPENKVPKKRGRPRRNPLPIILAKPAPPAPGSVIEPLGQRDPLALDDVTHMTPHAEQQMFPPIENEAHGRPKRTCRNQKSYAPPRRGRGRGGRGKRKMEMNIELTKRPRIEQDLDMIERSTTALITIHEPPSVPSQNTIDLSSETEHNTSELYKALRQPTMDRKMPNALARNEVEQAVNESCNNPDLMTKNHLESLMDARIMSHLDGVINTSINKTASEETFEKDRKMLLVDISTSEKQTAANLSPGELQKSQLATIDPKIIDKIVDDVKNNKNTSGTIDHENWLTPSSRKLCDAGRNEANISNVQVMDEETRMSAESGSRSQTPAKNMSLQAPETIVNEESQGSVLSTATTESEKVKVKIRRMEISFDPDEGPFTVDKVAEYDWPLDPTKKNETFMIQEQISHYLGVKSFKRKYPDLKRRMVDMEERNFLRENGLVSEAMCDMGLTAVLSSEVLDVMCSDFPDQYEEYRKHIREKQMKEHLKKQKELTAAANAEKNRIDLAEMAVQSALSWNIGLNKARRESRKCSLDLQTFTIHVPKKQQKVEEESGSNHYPVALIPGQYTDYYREYTPAELRYYPLNTVLYGPMRPNERKFDSQSEGSQSDSDSDSSSDDSSSTSSEGTQDTEASQSTMDDVDAELSRQKEDIKSIKCKMCLKHLNKFNRPEVLIQCGTCNGFVHPSCIDLTLDMVPHIQAYAWQCTDCKTCAQCHDPADEDKMLFCDMCDRGYHIYCVGLRRVPQGRWHCQECAVCASCGSREAGGTNSDRNSVAQWQHEYKKGDKNTRVYVSTLCVPCSKLWRKGRYCPHCSRCHTVPRLDLEVNLVHCSACDKYLHLGCVETKDLTVDRKNYRCDFCQPLRHHMVKPLVSKVFRT